ncbi:DUF2690 domain-containing protein [Streptomyces krungchingensis]
MPRWRALPDELDPQVKEFASQLRRLVDRSGLSVAAVADRTGYSKTSWERYLNGRLLAPKGAIVALAEVTGTNPVHLTTMWELAERAWSRSEMRHDMTMEAIRISQARAALGEFGPGPGPGSAPGKGGSGRQATRKGGSATVTPGVAGPAGVSPTVPSSGSSGSSVSSVPVQPTGPDAGESSSSSSSSSSSYGSGARGGSWGVVPSPSDPVGRYGPSASAGPARPGGPAGPGAGPGGPQDARPGGARRAAGDGARRKRRLTMFLAGVVGALVVVAVAVFLTSGDDKKEAGGTPKSPATSAAANPDLPAGVKCSGAECTGKDPENMGCGGELARTTSSATVGTALVEVRYSKTCGAAWARITQAAAGDQVDVSSGGAAKQTGSVQADTDAYTPMVAVKDAGDATACATLKSGQKGCTK